LAQNIFEGLEKFGFEVLADKDIDIFESQAKKQKAADEKAAAVFSIDNYVYAKNINCPVCKGTFESFVVKWGKTKLESVDYDLMPTYSPINHLYYDITSCKHCGYTADAKTFGKISDRQSELILTELKPLYKHVEFPKEPTIDMVIDRYKLALLSSTMKRAKQGEKAYLCMKLTWLYRIKGDDIINEKKFAVLAIKGFTQALEEEHTPIMGMEEVTILYLIAAFSKFLGHNKSALRILSTIITSRKSSERLKDRSRDLKDEIMKQSQNTQNV